MDRPHRCSRTPAVAWLFRQQRSRHCGSTHRRARSWVSPKPREESMTKNSLASPAVAENGGAIRETAEGALQWLEQLADRFEDEWPNTANHCRLHVNSLRAALSTPTAPAV